MPVSPAARLHQPHNAAPRALSGPGVEPHCRITSQRMDVPSSPGEVPAAPGNGGDPGSRSAARQGLRHQPFAVGNAAVSGRHQAQAATAVVLGSIIGLLHFADSRSGADFGPNVN